MERTRLDQKLDRLRSLLGDYRQELDQSQLAFRDWQAAWDARETEINRQLAQIESRLQEHAPRRPALSILHGDA